MKTALFLSLAVVTFVPARAQILRPEAVNGAVWGGIAGAVIGHNSGDLRHNAWKGAAIGAGAGLILGEMVGNANAAARATSVPVARSGGYVYRDRPEIYVGVDYGRGSRYGGSRYGHGRHPGVYRNYGYYGYHRQGWSGYGYGYGSVPVYGYSPGYGAGYPYYDSYGVYRSGSAASTGLFLGALAGGIIGHNSGDFRHNGWRGAAWGAGAGWLLGSIVDTHRPVAVYEAAPVVVPPVQTVPAPASPAPAAPPQPITIINNYYNAPSPMSSANGMFGR